MELMNKYARNVDEEEDMFEDVEQNDLIEGGCFELLMNLLRHLMLRFKEEFRNFSTKIF